MNHPYVKFWHWSKVAKSVPYPLLRISKIRLGTNSRLCHTALCGFSSILACAYYLPRFALFGVLSLPVVRMAVRALGTDRPRASSAVGPLEIFDQGVDRSWKMRLWNSNTSSISSNLQFTEQLNVKPAKRSHHASLICTYKCPYRCLISLQLPSPFRLLINIVTFSVFYRFPFLRIMRQCLPLFWKVFIQKKNFKKQIF